MASEYLLKKYKDVKPDEPVEMTPEEKRKNWWYYHRVHLLIALVAAALVFSFVWEMATKVDPDYQIAYIGEFTLPYGSSEAIMTTLESMLDDRNGDGEVCVLFNDYVMNENDPYAYAVQSSLIGDISMGHSSVFLVPDPMASQNMYGIFYQEDGTVPEDENSIESCMAYAWADCPAVNSIDLEWICM